MLCLKEPVAADGCRWGNIVKVQTLLAKKEAA